MDRRLDWIVWKGLFAAALYFAIVEQVGWVQYALSAIVWSMLIVSLWTAPQGSASRRIATISVPQVYVMIFDLGVIVAMFLAHWYWTAFAYAATCGCLALIQARRTSRL
jgi:hypothetical protein